MSYAFGWYRSRHYPSHVERREVFSAEEIAAIVKLGLALDPEQATMQGPEGSFVEPGYRQSRVSWIYPGPDADFLFSRLESLVHEINDADFGFDLIGLMEPLQFTEYEAPSVGYDWHDDMVDEPARLQRKLSVTVQLTSGDGYEGGDLELWDSAETTIAERGQGLLVAFPSWRQHRVTALQKGKRHSLVAWVSGPPFR